jgi:hypothetical protein
MSIVFSGSELINIAIGIERRGINNYPRSRKSYPVPGDVRLFRILRKLLPSF